MFEDFKRDVKPVPALLVFVFVALIFIPGAPKVWLGLLIAISFTFVVLFVFSFLKTIEAKNVAKRSGNSHHTENATLKQTADCLARAEIKLEPEASVTVKATKRKDQLTLGAIIPMIISFLLIAAHIVVMEIFEFSLFPHLSLEELGGLVYLSACIIFLLYKFATLIGSEDWEIGRVVRENEATIINVFFVAFLATAKILFALN